MITLDSLRAPDKRPLIATIVADGGMGKTTLASLFPRPVFIRTEDGTKSIENRQDVALFPLAKTSQEVFEAFGALLREDHSFKTVVLDSVTQLATMVEAEVVAADPKAKSINQAAGGYGAGIGQAAEVHRQIREVAGLLAEQKHMNVVFLAHADTETVDPPDGEAFTRYAIRMHRKYVAHYSDNTDLVGFIKLKRYTTGDGDKKKAVGDGTRVLTCYPTPSHISKNRFGIAEDIIFTPDVNPLAAYLEDN
jgi:hypothetical protein